jgi:hypothetical protein
MSLLHRECVFDLRAASVEAPRASAATPSRSNTSGISLARCRAERANWWVHAARTVGASFVSASASAQTQAASTTAANPLPGAHHEPVSHAIILWLIIGSVSPPRMLAV